MSASPLPEGDNTPPVLREDRDAVALLVLNRPGTRNSLSRAMMAALAARLEEVAADDGVRAVVLAAEGPGFSGGHDLKELTAHRGDPDGGQGFFAETMAACADLMQSVVNLPQPVVAAVEGIATAAGCQLAASCDLVVAGEGARFGASGINAGLFCSTPGVALARAMPRKAALELLLLGELVPAAEAHRMGLANRVVPDGTAREAAVDLATRIARHSGLALRLGKRGFNAQDGLPLAEAYEVAGRVMVENLLAEDAVEGIGAFIGKRRPEWRHR